MNSAQTLCDKVGLAPNLRCDKLAGRVEDHSVVALVDHKHASIIEAHISGIAQRRGCGWVHWHIPRHGEARPPPDKRCRDERTSSEPDDAVVVRVAHERAAAGVHANAVWAKEAGRGWRSCHTRRVVLGGRGEGAELSVDGRGGASRLRPRTAATEQNEQREDHHDERARLLTVFLQLHTPLLWELSTPRH